MEPLILQTASEDAGKRLDAWLAEQTELTRSAVQKLMEEGRVTAAGKPLAKNTRLTDGETVSVKLPEPEAVDIVPQNIPLDVVYEDEDVIVVNKPKGLVVHPAPGHPDGTLVNALLYHCGDSLSGINGELRPGIVHRIDRDTSGLIIAAKDDFAHVKLAEQLQDHTLARTYRCIVTGNLREDTGTVNAPIGRCPADRKKMAVVAGGRNAVTHWTVLERYPGVNYVECRLETGRTHQIRVHMAYIGHPILGDTVYGTGHRHRRQPAVPAVPPEVRRTHNPAIPPPSGAVHASSRPRYRAQQWRLRSDRRATTSDSSTLSQKLTP